MYENHNIALILPAKNEASALPIVMKDIPAEIDRIIIVDNGSTDKTSQVAKNLGAEVVQEPKTGYGKACLRGLSTLEANPPDIVAFADADGSDDIARLGKLIQPIACGQADLVLEKRVPFEPGVFSVQQRFGNWLATSLVRLFWRHSFADLGPMRAIRWVDLQALNMKDQNFGWTIEMQIKALKRGFRITEYPLPYKKRAAGRSKVSRTLSGSFRAGTKILWIIVRELFSVRSICSKKLRDARGTHEEAA
jgi:glycosyltransferase involved in cell wall biosynthesis